MQNYTQSSQTNKDQIKMMNNSKGNHEVLEHLNDESFKEAVACRQKPTLIKCLSLNHLKQAQQLESNKGELLIKIPLTDRSSNVGL